MNILRISINVYVIEIRKKHSVHTFVSVVKITTTTYVAICSAQLKNHYVVMI